MSRLESVAHINAHTNRAHLVASEAGLFLEMYNLELFLFSIFVTDVCNSNMT